MTDVGLKSSELAEALLAYNKSTGTDKEVRMIMGRGPNFRIDGLYIDKRYPEYIMIEGYL
jgi:hypothetical protein